MRRAQGWLIFILLVSCVSNPIPSRHREPASITQESQKLSFQKLRDILEEKKFSSVEKTLAYLSKNYKDYLSYHTLVYDTLSIQPSEYQYPRAIVYGEKADFVFSFNSHIPGHKFDEANALEMIEFDKKTKSFELHEIEFIEDSTNKKRFKGKPYHISEANPDKCLQCHSDGSLKHSWQVNTEGKKFDLTIHPNWKTYFLWPGVYGSLDDNLTGQQRRQISAFKDKKNREATEYEKFMGPQGNRWKGRYQYLPALAEDTYGTVNFQFTDALMAHNVERIGALLKTKASLLKPYRYSLFAPFSCVWLMRLAGKPDVVAKGSSYADYISQQMALPPGFRNRLAETFNESVSRCTNEIDDAKAKILSPDGLTTDSYDVKVDGSSSEMCRMDNIDMSIAIAFAEWAGLDPDNWAMNETSGGRRFMDDTARPLYMARSILLNLFSPEEYQDVLKADPKKASYFGSGMCEDATKKASMAHDQ